MRFTVLANIHEMEGDPTARERYTFADLVEPDLLSSLYTAEQAM